MKIVDKNYISTLYKPVKKYIGRNKITKSILLKLGLNASDKDAISGLSTKEQIVYIILCHNRYNKYIINNGVTKYYMYYFNKEFYKNQAKFFAKLI